MALGDIAGGIAQGYMQGEELKLRKKRDKREQEQADFEREQRDRQRRIDAAGGAIRMPGEMTTDGYDTEAKAQEAIAKAVNPNATTPQKSGVLGALGKFLRPREAAIGAGVVMPDAGGGALPPGALPGGVPQAGGGIIPRQGQETPDPNEIVVNAPGPRRATMVDTLQDQMIAMRAAGASPKDIIPVIQQYQGELAKENLTILATWDAPRIANRLSDLMDVPVSVEEHDNGSVEVQFGDNKPTTYKNRNEAFAALGGMMTQNPEAGIRLGLEFRKVALQEQQLDLTRQRAISDIRTNAARVGLEGRRVGLAERQFEAGQQKEGQLLQALDLLNNEDNALLNPEAYEAAMALATQYMPQYAKGTIRQADAEGNITQVPTNIFAHAANTRRQQFESSPYRAYIAVAPDAEGNAQFWVRDPKGQPVYAASLNDAEMKARKFYGTPKAK